MAALQLDALLFDMDGTLIDESRSYREAIRRTAELLLDEPVSPAEVEAIKDLPGLNDDWDATWALISSRRGGVPQPASEEERRSDAYRRLKNIFQTYYLGDRVWHELSGDAPLFAWKEPLMCRETLLVSRETLDGLSHLTLGIATSRPRVEALMALQQHELGTYFPPGSVVAREDAPRQKPDPAPLLELVNRLRCRRPAYVGDTINDALAAAAAGMPFIGVYAAVRGADSLYHLDDVNDILTLISGETVGQAGKGS